MPPARPPRTRRSTREHNGGSGSELLTRILIAVPAIFVVVLFIDIGRWPFALFMLAIAWAAMHELYRMLARWRPLVLVGFVSAAAMVLLAHQGGQRLVLEAAVATLPVVFLAAAVRGQGHSTVAIAGTLLGVYWIGFATAHAVLLRDLRHGNGVIIESSR